MNALSLSNEGEGRKREVLTGYQFSPSGLPSLKEYVFIPQRRQGNGSDFVTGTYSISTEVVE